MSRADPTAAARMRRYRQRLREENDRNGRNGRNSVTLNRIESLEKEVAELRERNVTLEQEIQKLKSVTQLRSVTRNATPKTKKCALPEDFTIPPDWIEDGYAARKRHGKPWVDLTLQAEVFCNRQYSTGAIYVNWHRTWINWCLNSLVDKGEANGQRLSATDKFWLGAAQAAESFEARRRANHPDDDTLLDFERP
jgi:hypothetical protein